MGTNVFAAALPALSAVARPKILVFFWPTPPYVGANARLTKKGGLLSEGATLARLHDSVV